MSRDQAGAIWDVLVKHAGAGEHDRESFVMAFSHPAMRPTPTEWRFCGSLGFGGKFWDNAGQWYVSCYPEDATVERRRIIQKVNGILDTLRALAFPGRP